MPQYKITFDFAEQLNGWSESYYRVAGTPASAATFEREFFETFFAFRGNAPRIYRIRVSDVANPRRGETFPVNESWIRSALDPGGSQPQNDAPSLAFEVKITDAGGRVTYRLFRGLYDTRYSGIGTFDPPERYKNDVIRFVRGCGRAGLQARFLVRASITETRLITQLGPGPDSFHQTAITYSAAPPWSVGKHIVFKGLNRSYFPGLRNGVQVIDRPSANIDLVACRWTGPITVVPGGLARAEEQKFDYAILARGELVDIRSHRTGRPPALHRGRSSGVRYR